MSPTAIQKQQQQQQQQRASYLHDEILQKVSRQLPYTHTGQPRGYYRPDLIPPEVAEEDINDVLDAAFVELHHEEGFPAFPDGRPFWHRMEQEPEGAFQVFQLFLEQGSTNVRTLQALLESPEALYHVKRNFQISAPLQLDFLNQDPDESDVEAEQEEKEELGDSALRAVKNSVSLAVTANFTAPPKDFLSPEGQAYALGILRRWFFTYYWRERSKASDNFRAAAYRHIRLKRALSAENRHFEVAEKLLDKMAAYFDSPRFLEEVNAKVATDMLKTVVAIQRASTGLASAGMGGSSSGGKNGEEQPHDFEMVLRSITAKNHKESAQIIDEQGRLVPSADTLLRDVLGDADATRLMQEIVIKITSPKSGSKSSRSGDELDSNSSSDESHRREDGLGGIHDLPELDEGMLRTDLGLN